MQEEKEMFKMSMTIADFTTCWGTLQLYSALEEINRQGATVLYCDTDSVIFTNASLPIGANYVGYIIDFVSIREKSYAFKTNKDDNAIKTKGIGKRYIDFRFIEMEKLVMKELIF